METIDDLFAKLNGPANVGRIIGVTTEHAAAMKRRGSIPASYWPRLVESRDAGVTYETLAAIAVRRCSVPRPNTGEAAA